jgi:hypothetical protein
MRTKVWIARDESELDATRDMVYMFFGRQPTLKAGVWLNRPRGTGNRWPVPAARDYIFQVYNSEIRRPKKQTKNPGANRRRGNMRTTPTDFSLTQTPAMPMSPELVTQQVV